MVVLNIWDYSSLLFGTPSVSIDLVWANSSEGSSPKVVGTIRNSTDLDRSIPGTVSDTWLLQRPGYSHLPALVHRVQPYTFPIIGGFADNTTIPDGEYRAFLKALRVFGDPSNSGDVETYLSPVFIKGSASGTVTQP